MNSKFQRTREQGNVKPPFAARLWISQLLFGQRSGDNTNEVAGSQSSLQPDSLMAAHLQPYKQQTHNQPSKSAGRRQRGMSLLELMVAMGLSMVVSTTGVKLLGNTMGTATKVIQTTQLSHALRSTMQIVSRDIRRAGYTANAMWCIANTTCLSDLTINRPLGGSFKMPAAITINDEADCITFALDRDHDGTAAQSEHGAYRRRVIHGVGRIEMWVGNSAPDCESGSPNWAQVTDPKIANVTSFQLDGNESFDELVATDILGNTTTQRIRRITIAISGELVTDGSVNEYLKDTIDVRNDILL